jgi:hypothetical protein
MIEINFKTEIQNFNPIERTCMVFLYGITIQDDKETGRFFLDKKFLVNDEYDLYVNQANQSIDIEFLKKWEDAVLMPMKDLIEEFKKDSNKI